MDEYKSLNEKEEKIRNEILQHLSTVVIRISEITEFDYEKILTETFENKVLEYKYTIKHDWHREFNNKGIFGGYSDRGYNESLEAL